MKAQAYAFCVCYENGRVKRPPNSSNTQKQAKFKGDYRTKRVILEIYDALAAAMQTGQPYQTRLNPPPADVRCCHPAKSPS